MLRSLLLLSVCLVALAACGHKSVAEFWRPISEPNLQLSQERGQAKLEFDLSQCRCGIFPSNVAQSDLTSYQPDEQRIVQTSVFSTRDAQQNCIQRPSLVVAECMRGRGWEVTRCSGRMAAGNGAAICALTKLDE